MTTPSLGGIDLSQLNSIDINKRSNLLPLPMPTGDSDETEVFDMLGVVKTITLNGQIVESSVSAVKAIVDSLEALAAGDQENTISFISDQTGTISVKVMSIQIGWKIPGFTADYSIQIVQGV